LGLREVWHSTDGAHDHRGDDYFNVNAAVAANQLGSGGWFCLIARA